MTFVRNTISAKGGIVMFCIICCVFQSIHCRQQTKSTVLEDLIPDFRDIGAKIDGNGEKTDLWLTGIYIAAHKYFGADFRYLTGNVGPDDQVFYKKFPSPTLRDLDPKLTTSCDQSATQCIREVHDYAKRSGSLQHLMKPAEELLTYAPFKNNYEEFRFRQTAMYYLCWYTKIESPEMKFSAGDVSCLSHLNAVNEIPEERRQNLLKRDEMAINDIRNSNYKKDPFICANLWFCPDPCYGRMDKGNFVKPNFKVEGNPCLKLKNSQCAWEDKANHNFDDLIRNKFNITCDCASERPGFHWSSRFSLCVDTDECYENKHNCPENRICKNTVGGFMCTCLRGYDINPATDECERLLTMHQSATMLNYEKSYHSKPHKKEESDFISEIMEIVGLSSASVNTLFPCIVMLSSLVHILI